MADAVPVVSQVKSFVQWVSGDSEGAERTQQNFSKRCPIISQARSAVEALSGDTEAAENTQKEFLNEVSNFVDAVPVVGHVKGGIHYACGDTEGGDSAMKAASRTTGAVAGGVGGFFVAGPPGAVAGGIGGAAAMDAITTGVDSAVHNEFRPAGLIQQGVDIYENPTDAGKWFDTGFMVVGDGLAGYAGGEAVVRGKQFVKQRAVRKQFEGKRQPLVVRVGKQGAKDLVNAADHMDKARSKYNIPENKPHLTSLVLDEHNKAFEGHNQQARQYCQKAKFEPDVMSDYSRKSSTYLERKVPNAKPPLERPARTCAEHRAYHKYYKDQPNAEPNKTRVATVRYDKRAKTIQAAERCDNCKAYGEGMGEVPGDLAHSMEVPNHPGIGKYSYYREGAKAAGFVGAGAYFQEHPDGNGRGGHYRDSKRQESDHESDYDDDSREEYSVDDDRESDYDKSDRESDSDYGFGQIGFEDGYRGNSYEGSDAEGNYKEGYREASESDMDNYQEINYNGYQDAYRENNYNGNEDTSSNTEESNEDGDYGDDHRASNYEHGYPESDKEDDNSMGSYQDNYRESNNEESDRGSDNENEYQENGYDHDYRESNYQDGYPESNSDDSDQEGDDEDGYQRRNYQDGYRDRNFDDSDEECDNEAGYRESNYQNGYRDANSDFSDEEGDYEDDRGSYYGDDQDSD